MTTPTPAPGEAHAKHQSQLDPSANKFHSGNGADEIISLITPFIGQLSIGPTWSKNAGLMEENDDLRARLLAVESERDEARAASVEWLAACRALSSEIGCPDDIAGWLIGANELISHFPADTRKEGYAQSPLEMITRIVDERDEAREDVARITKLDRLLQEDPFRFRIKWDNYQDSGVYVFDGMDKQVGHSEQLGDGESDADGKTLRAAIDNIKNVP